MASYKDPTDHFRTTLPHTGEHFIDVYSWPGYCSILLGVMSLVAGVAAAAYQRTQWVPTAGIVGVLAIAGGAAWLVIEHRRILRIESLWQREHARSFPNT
ncbi:protein UsfY [Mycolicibacterium cosmeticum]|jgi:hypothetical protein|uniref:protein UsfY n=1 Tax=Mycolicibacterium cosmeticum TaxID=258533 RepID=UPI003204F935